MEKVYPVCPKAQAGPDYEFLGGGTLDWGFRSSGMQDYQLIGIGPCRPSSDDSSVNTSDGTVIASEEGMTQ
jgi:hypothetical protein